MINFPAIAGINMNKAIIFLISQVWPIFKKTKNYARIVGVILFAIGLLGFAFRSDHSLPDIYLTGALILGFWGILSGFADNGVNYAKTEFIEKQPYSSK